MENWLEITLFCITCLVLLAFVLRKLAAREICFTFGSTNIVKYGEKGGDGKHKKGVLHKYIPITPGWTLVIPEDNLKEASFKEQEKGDKQPFSWFNRILLKYLGIYFYGIYPFYRIKKLVIIKRKDNLEGTGPKDWIIDLGKVEVDGLMFTFPRPFVFTKVKLADGLDVDLKLVVKLRIIKPYIPIYELDTDFFLQIASIIQGEVIDEIKTTLTIKDFVLAEKGEVDGILSEYKEKQPDGSPSKVNKELIRQTGVMIDGISISDWKPSDPEVEKLMKAEAEATILGDANIIKATKEKEVIGITADAYNDRVNKETSADFNRAKKLAEAGGVEVKQIIDNLSIESANSDLIVETVGKIVQARSIRDSKVTTWVQGDAKAVVAVGDGGKQ